MYVHACEGCLSEYSRLKVDVNTISCCLFMNMDVHEGKFVVIFILAGKPLQRTSARSVLEQGEDGSDLSIRST